jgi:RNA polymerase sigma-32 factor
MTITSHELSFVSTVASRTPTLQRDQEVELARRLQASGDPRAADTLVRAHLRIVVVLAIKYRHYGIPVSELVAEGNCGLLVALRRFDPERGIRFGTYAKHWIRAHMLACVVQSSNVLGGTSASRAKLFFKLRRERARAASLLGEGATSEEALAQRLNVSAERLQRLLGDLDARCVSLDESQDRQAAHTEEALTSPDNPEARYFDERRRSVVNSAIAAALDVLDTRERFIAEQRIMAASDAALSLTEIGKALGISRERARQLEERAKRKLRLSPAIHRNTGLDEWRACC